MIFISILAQAVEASIKQCARPNGCLFLSHFCISIKILPIRNNAMFNVKHPFGIFQMFFINAKRFFNEEKIVEMTEHTNSQKCSMSIRINYLIHHHFTIITLKNIIILPNSSKNNHLKFVDKNKQDIIILHSQTSIYAIQGQ